MTDSLRVYAINAVHLCYRQLTLNVRHMAFICIWLRHVNAFVNGRFSAEFYYSFLLVIFISVLRICVFNFHILNRLGIKLLSTLKERFDAFRTRAYG
jgi:hypothetical protein